MASAAEPGRILSNTLYRLLADVGGKVASFALYVYMARKLGESSFGVFTFALALVAITCVLADFGQDRVLTREVAREHGRLDRYLANTIVLKLVVALPALALSVLVLSLVGQTGETRTVVAVLGLAVIVDLLTSTTFAAYQAFERLEFYPIVLIAERVVTAVGGIVAIYLGAGVEIVAGIFLVSALLAFALSLLVLFVRVVRPGLEVDARTWLPLMRAAAPIGLASVFAVILFRADSVMLRAYESSAVVGNYGAAYRLFEATLFLSWAVSAAVYPVLARISGDEVRLVYERSLKLVIALTLPLAVGTAVLGREVVQALYGTAFDAGGGALVLLAPAIALFPVAYIAGYLLVARDRSLWAAGVFAVVAVENIAANFVLIPALSLRGAAIGTSISEVITVALLLVLADREAGHVRAMRIAAGPVAAGAISAATMAAARGNLAAAIAGGAAAYAVSLAVFERIVFPADARVLWAWVRLGRRYAAEAERPT